MNPITRLLMSLALFGEKIMHGSNRKASITVIQGIFYGLIGVGIIALVGFTVADKLKSTFTDNTSAGYNGTVLVETSMSDAVGWLPALIPILIGIAILGYLKFGRK